MTFQKQQQQQQQSTSSVTSLAAQPSYQLGDLNLSEKWLELVRNDKVSTTTEIELPSCNQTIQVSYGVRLLERSGGYVCAEFATEVGLSPGEVSKHPTIRSINATLTKAQQESADDDEDGGGHDGKVGLKFKEAGGFIAQLQLVRTLRPSPSPGIAAATSSVAPPYKPETDSFVTGPLRLDNRPLVGRLHLDGSLTTLWDVYHNVSPADTRGHFLLLPTISDEKNWRGQTFTDDDCHDVVRIAGSIEPPGSLCLGYNSIGAAASQNHIHLHIWPCPPLPLVQMNKADENGDPVEPWHAYPVTKVCSIYDFCDVNDGAVEASYLEYPVFCILLSASLDNLDLLGRSLAKCVGSIDDAPFNIVFLNRIQSNDEDGDDRNGGQDKFVDAYFFVRSKERSDVLPTLKLGMSEMLGVFHAQNDSELDELSTYRDDGHNEADGRKSRMEEALEDVSINDDDGLLWKKIKNNLSSIK